MDNLLILRHKYEFWKQRYDQTKSQEDLAQMQKWFQAYMKFVDNVNIPQEEIQSVSDRYDGYTLIRSEEIIESPFVLRVSDDDDRAHADNIPLIRDYLEKTGIWCSAGDIGKALRFTPPHVRQLLNQLYERSLVEKMREKHGRILWKISSTS